MKKKLSEIFGGLIILALGVIFLLAANGVIASSDWWIYFLLALGGIFVLDSALRNSFLKENFFGGRFIAGIILAGIGLSLRFRFRNWWPSLLILVGLLIILKGIFSRHPKSQVP